jgi:hypothetical protein
LIECYKTFYKYPLCIEIEVSAKNSKNSISQLRFQSFSFIELSQFCICGAKVKLNAKKLYEIYIYPLCIEIEVYAKI